MNETQIETFIGGQVYWLLGLALLFLVRNLIEEVIAGILIFFGNDYNMDDVVLFDDLPSRIIRVGLYKSIFFIYRIENDPYTGKAHVSGGYKRVVKNSALKDHNIDKPLVNIDITNHDKIYHKKLERRDEINNDVDS